MGKLDEDDWPVDVVETAAYLGEVFTVQRVVPEPVGDFELCVPLRPPIPIDDIVRPPGHGPDVPIGSLRQGAWRLRDELADQLCRDSPGVYESLFGQE